MKANEGKMSPTKDKKHKFNQQAAQRQLNMPIAIQRPGRLSVAAGTPMAHNLESFVQRFERTPTPTFVSKTFEMRHKLSIASIQPVLDPNFKPPAPALRQEDHPGKYIAKTLNLVYDFKGKVKTSYSVDKRMNSSVKIKFEVFTDAQGNPSSGLIQIYEYAFVSHQASWDKGVLQ